MTEKKYTGFSVEDLIHDQEFVSIVIKMSTAEEWEQFLQSHNESKHNILRARKIIQLFKTSNVVLPDGKKYELWKNISRFNAEFSRNYKIARIKSAVRVAASILIIISLGSLLYLNFNQVENQYQFPVSQNNLKTEKPMLVLSNGEEVELKQNESKIIVLKGQNAIQINNDSVVENRSSIDKTTKEVKFNEVIIPFGKKSKLVLEDGTKVWLNAGTRFAFPPKFERKERVVYLEGEAYFEVKKNVNQPFIISTDKINVEVLGTKFNVHAYKSDDFSETVLLEGSINIWEKSKLFNDKILMVPNQKATYNKVIEDIKLTFDPVPEMNIAWIEGWYQFTNEKLENVLKKLERYYNVSFEYDQAVISKVLPVSGKLDLKDSLNEVMIVLSGVAKFEYQISGNSVIIVK